MWVDFSSSESSASGMIRKTGWVAALRVICRLARFGDYFWCGEVVQRKKEWIPTQLKNKFSNLCEGFLTFFLEVRPSLWLSRTWAVLMGAKENSHIFLPLPMQRVSRGRWDPPAQTRWFQNHWAMGLVVLQDQRGRTDTTETGKSSSGVSRFFKQRIIRRRDD